MGVEIGASTCQCCREQSHALLRVKRARHRSRAGGYGRAFPNALSGPIGHLGRAVFEGFKSVPFRSCYMSLSGGEKISATAVSSVSRPVGLCRPSSTSLILLQIIPIDVFGLFRSLPQTLVSHFAHDQM